MKTSIKLFLMVFALSLSSTLFAQEKSYKDGSVWQVGLIKANANMTVDYLNDLKNNWKLVQDEAVKEGLILSYKILQGAAANPEDWDIMLMTEYKNFASIQGMDDKWSEISKKIIGGEDGRKKLNESRVSMRTIYGGKLLREVIYK